LIIHRRAEVTCVGVRGHRPRVLVCAQECPHEFIETDRLGPASSIVRFNGSLTADLCHDGGVIRHDGLHQRWGQSDRLPIGCPLGDAPHKLEKLRRPNDCVWDRRGFDQISPARSSRGSNHWRVGVRCRRPTAPRDVRRLRLLPRRGDCDPTFSKNSKTASSSFQKSRSAIIRFIYSCKLILLAGSNCRAT
jgi:hypothetical protein